MADVHQRSLPIFASFQRQNLQVELQHSSPLMRGLLHQIRAKLFYIVAGWNWVITIITITFECHLCILKNCLHQATHTPCIIQDTHTQPSYNKNLEALHMWQKRFNANTKPTAGADAAALVPGSSPINLSTMLEAIYHDCKFIRRLRVQLVVSRQGKWPPTKASHFC